VPLGSTLTRLLRCRVGFGFESIAAAKSCPVASHVNLLGYLQSSIDLDAEVANRALFVVVQQKLDQLFIPSSDRI
jgi:hypothetical protein